MSFLNRLLFVVAVLQVVCASSVFSTDPAAEPATPTEQTQAWGSKKAKKRNWKKLALVIGIPVAALAAVVIGGAVMARRRQSVASKSGAKLTNDEYLFLSDSQGFESRVRIYLDGQPLLDQVQELRRFVGVLQKIEPGDKVHKSSVLSDIVVSVTAQRVHSCLAKKPVDEAELKSILLDCLKGQYEFRLQSTHPMACLELCDYSARDGVDLWRQMLDGVPQVYGAVVEEWRELMHSAVVDIIKKMRFNKTDKAPVGDCCRANEILRNTCPHTRTDGACGACEEIAKDFCYTSSSVR